MNPFDYVSSITYTKKDLFDPEQAEQPGTGYSSFHTLRSLSYFHDCIPAANAMNQASNLEQRNMAQVMKDEFVYGMTKMGQEYDFQSRFAVDEANRNLNQIAMQGDTEMNKTSNEYSEVRETQRALWEPLGRQ